MTDKPRHPTPTEQAAMDARLGKPDASGAQEEMMDCYQFGTVPAHDKQQPAQRHELSERNKKYADQLSAHMDEGGKYGVNNVRDLIGMVFEMADALDAQAAEIVGLSRRADNQDRWARKYRAEAALAKQQNAALREALINARPLVEKWCHYQGDTEALFRQYLDPIDAALEASDKQQPARRYEHVAPKRLYAEAKRAEERGNHSEAYFMRQAADALDEQAAEIAAYERLDEEGYASLAVDLAAAEQRIADLEYANSDTAGEQQLRIFAKQNAALREALARLTNAVSLGRIGPKPSKIGGVPRYEFSKRQNDILEIAFAKARAALEAGDE